MLQTLTTTFAGRFLITLLSSMIPVTELRGGLPFGVGLGLPVWAALMASIIGNLIPIPFLLLFLKRFLRWLKGFKRLGRIAEKLENKAAKHSDKIHKYGRLGLFILVAIPLPGTGAWTGSLVAALLDMRIKDALPMIILGVVTAGVIVAGITYGVTSFF